MLTVRSNLMDQVNSYWRKCGSCKKEIGFNTIYQMCNVSTCRKLVFCSVDCWNLHNPVMNHKSSWAEENRSPRKEEVLVDNNDSGQSPRRILVQSKSSTPASVDDSLEILIVASKLKQYIKDKYDMNTAGNVMEALSRDVRRLTDRAVEKARSEGRKTVMDRDYE
jgi:histone H3/H4